MAEPSPRQLLYAMVAAGFMLVVGVLIVASAGLAPTWWTVTMATLWVASAATVAIRWRRTAMVLGLSLGLFVVWTVGAAFVLT